MKINSLLPLNLVLLSQVTSNLLGLETGALDCNPQSIPESLESFLGLGQKGR